MAASQAAKIVFDTNIYVDRFRIGRLEDLFAHAPTQYLSSIVVMELLAGSGTSAARRVVERLIHSHQSTGRLLVPSHLIYERAGSVMRQLREGGRETRQASLVNDVLIALTVRSSGATLYTADRDFLAIREVVDFRLEIVS